MRTVLPLRHVERFEDDHWRVFIDHERPCIYVVSIKGKLPGGESFHRLEDFRSTYAEARALVRSITDQ